MSTSDDTPAKADASATAPAKKKPARKARKRGTAKQTATGGDKTVPAAGQDVTAEPRPAARKEKPAATRKARNLPPREPVAAKPAAPESLPATATDPAAAAESAAPRRMLLSTRLDVRWGDMDAFNHVNNAVFLSYLEEARLRWLQGLSGPWLDDNTAPLLAAAHVDYRRPIEWPCSLAIELYADRVGNSSLTLGHRIVDAADTTIVFSEGHTVMVWIDRRNGKGSKLPDAVRRACEGD